MAYDGMVAVARARCVRRRARAPVRARRAWGSVRRARQLGRAFKKRVEDNTGKESKRHGVCIIVSYGTASMVKAWMNQGKKSAYRLTNSDLLRWHQPLDEWSEAFSPMRKSK